MRTNWSSNTKLEKEFKLKVKKTNIMNMSSKRGIILAIVLFSISLILIPSNVQAEEINVKSIGVEKTSIITLTNDGFKDVKTFRIWLSQDTNFQSFKTEKGWTGEKNEQGVIIFTSSEPINKSESVKFGIKTNKINPIINWKGLDETNSVIDKGVIKSKNLEKVTRIFFNHRRKMLKKPFNQLFNGDQRVLNELKIDLNLRPQNLDFDTYYRLTCAYENLRS